jgi:integrase/recombinase XerD
MWPVTWRIRLFSYLPTLDSRFESEHVPVLRSANTYRFAIRNLASRLGSILLDGLSRQDIADFIATRQNVGVKPSTIKRELVVLSSAMTFAVGWGWAGQSMAGLLERRMLKPSPPRRRYLTHAEEERLLEAALPRLRPLIIFAIETGLRKEEQFSLKWHQIDLDRRELKLFVTKSGTPRIVPLSDWALAVLSELPRYPASPFVFVNPATGTRYV